VNDVLMTAVVVLLLAAVTALLSLGHEPSMRSWIWIALAEHLVCAAAQLFYSRVVVGGGDTILYAQAGEELAKFLHSNFSWASREILALLLQKPSAFDTVVLGGGGNNTASMYAACAWLLFFLGDSDYAAHVFVSGLAFFGALSIFKAFRDAYPQGKPLRLFVATVLFPSVAFWTSALHKEAFCIAGMGLLLAGWRAVYRRQVRALVFVPAGLGLVFLFRAPAIPPLLLGLVVFFAADRFRKMRGADTVLLGPVYLAVALGALAFGMIVLARVSPALSLEQLGETVAHQQKGWELSKGGSSFAAEELQQTLPAQILRFPVGLFNALFRPQFFDVNNFAALISAVEMTTITWMIVRAARQHGIRGIFARLQQSPFLLMCAVVTLVGCTFVGLVTLNFGSLARYRVPFLPFYGALVAVLSTRTSPVSSTAAQRASAAKQGRSRRRSVKAAASGARG
jgi:hypothetical protein